jgi:S-DNA-T family DNA segregation ATPase FtsK/SpoIIIE
LAQQKLSKQSKKSAAKPVNKAANKSANKAEQQPSNVERYSVKPEFWDTILDALPPWGDEIAAILLIVFGIVSFLSLLNASTDATISRAWSDALKNLFGWGGMVVSGAIMMLGVVILLPKLGMVVRFPTRRIIALELAFLAMLALMHLLSGEVELRALARAGGGGGQVGWALSVLVSSVFGALTATIVYSIILLLSLGTVIGMRTGQLKDWVNRLGDRLNTYGETMAARAQTARERLKAEATPPPDPLGQALNKLNDPNAETPKKLPPIARIRPNPASVPPSLRLDTLPPDEDDDELTDTDASGVKNVGNAKIRGDRATGEDPTTGEPADDPAEHPLFHRDEVVKQFQSIGTLKGKKTKKNRFIEVERPDGRLKRYFTVDDISDPKYIGKRDPVLPPLNLLGDIELNPPDEGEINNNVVLIENTLLEFDIDIDVVDVKVGPTVTQYAVQPFREGSSRTRISKIASLSSDLALSLSAKRLRLETPVPGHSYIGIEVPNQQPSTVALRSVYESRYYYEDTQKNKSPLLVPLGRDVSGLPVSIDIGAMPHLLIAGTTGSGKSVCMAALATALVLNNTPDLVRMVMLDPKMVELSRFNGIPHLLGPVETDQERIIGVLRWCTREMDRRYRLLEEHAARNIDTFNSRLGRRRKDEYLPYIVVMIDEIGDLMMSRPEETEKTLTRLAQMARAVGMHLIVATQRPSVDVITGLIKANFPSRISFNVTSGIDSRVILDAMGAETLLGMGDMLYQPADANAPRRVQGCFVSDDEVRSVVKYWDEWHKTQVETGKSEKIGIGPWERGLTRREFLSETDPMLEQAIELVVAEGEASASLIQRRLGVGYPRAARIMDLLEELGIIGSVQSGGRSREVLIQPGKDPFKDLIERRIKGM